MGCANTRLLYTMMLRLTLGLVVGFTLLIGIVYVLAYHTPDLQWLLLPGEDCEAPCFMGLRPEITSQQEAIERFEKSEFINFVVQNEGQETALLLWRDTRNTYSGSVYFRDGAVSSISFQGFRLYEIWLTLGEPDGSSIMAEELISVAPDRWVSLPVSHVEIYASYGLQVDAAADCARFWNQLAYVSLVTEPLPKSASPQPMGESRREICASQREYHQLR